MTPLLPHSFLSEELLTQLPLTDFLVRAFLGRSFYGLGMVKTSFLALGTTAFSFFEVVLRAKRLAI